MKLFDILKNTEGKIIQGNDLEIRNITIDSREVTKLSLFFCIRGLRVDGHNFINQVSEAGAAAVVIDREVDVLPEDLTVVKVNDVRKALSIAAANFFKNPADSLNLIGVTGTNGKTSTTYFIEKILQNANRKVGIIGTIDSKANGKHLNVYSPTPTTPDSIPLHKIFAGMKDEQTQDVVMEVSSHALALNKVYGLKFNIGIFSNLTQDHLDFHKTMDEYLKAKSILFSQCETGIINIDDPSAKYIIDNASCEIITYGIKNNCDFKAENVSCLSNSVSFDLMIDGNFEHFSIPIPGVFTVYNSLSAICAAYKMGVSVKLIKESLKNMPNVPGRMQTIPNDKNINIIVDYAHTPDSLENVISVVKNFAKGKVITVFGCGGDRDKNKRPIMGEIAGKLSDYCIITSDNPRTEAPEKILEDIQSGILKTNCEHEMILERKEAIFRAISFAEQNDTIIIAGKGHENYQIFADRTVHFDDSEIAQEALKNLNGGNL